MRRGAKPTKARVSRKSRKNGDPRIRDLEKRLAESLEREKATGRALTEALEQQTATSEILRAISGSPTDVQPVFDAIVRSAGRLCGGVFSIVLRFDGELIHFVAHHNFSPDALTAYRQWFPRRAVDDHLVGRAILERRVMNVPNVTAEFRFVAGQISDLSKRLPFGHRAEILVTPTRRSPGPRQPRTRHGTSPCRGTGTRPAAAESAARARPAADP